MLRVVVAVAGIWLAFAIVGPHGTRRAPAAGAPPLVASSALPSVAYRPGEPMLVPGAIELPRGSNGHFYAPVSVNGQAVQMMVDTGATGVALTIEDARRLGLGIDPTGFRVIGSGASGPVRGLPVMLDDVAVGDRHVAQVAAVVVEGLGQSLLGQSYLRRLDQVQISGDTMTLR